MEKDKARKVSFEIHSSSDGNRQYLIKAEDADKALDDPEKLRHLIGELKRSLEAMDEKPKKKDKK